MTTIITELKFFWRTVLLRLCLGQDKSGIMIVSFLFISDLNVGQYMSILIEEVKNDGRVVRLTQNPEVLAKAFTTIQHGWTLDTILPGLLIRARVKKVSRDLAGP